MSCQGAASILFALTATATAVAQTPSAQNNPVSLFHDVSRVALKNIRVIDGTGAPARAHQTLMIESGRILALGNVNEVRIPEGPRSSISTAVPSCPVS